MLSLLRDLPISSPQCIVTCRCLRRRRGTSHVCPCMFDKATQTEASGPIVRYDEHHRDAIAGMPDLVCMSQSMHTGRSVAIGKPTDKELLHESQPRGWGASKRQPWRYVYSYSRRCSNVISSRTSSSATKTTGQTDIQPDRHPTRGAAIKTVRPATRKAPIQAPIQAPNQTTTTCLSASGRKRPTSPSSKPECVASKLAGKTSQR